MLVKKIYNYGTKNKIYLSLLGAFFTMLNM